jgi:hypothetical protein
VYLVRSVSLDWWGVSYAFCDERRSFLHLVKGLEIVSCLLEVNSAFMGSIQVPVGDFLK